MVTFRNHNLQNWCLWTLYLYCRTAVYRPSFVLCAQLLHGNRVVRPLWSLFVTTIYRSEFFGHLSSISPPWFICPLLSFVIVFFMGTMWFNRYVLYSWPRSTGVVSLDTLTLMLSPWCTGAVSLPCVQGMLTNCDLSVWCFFVSYC